MAKFAPKAKAPTLAIVAIVVLLIVLVTRKGKSAPAGSSSSSAYAPGASSPGPFAPDYSNTSPVDTGMVYGPPTPSGRSTAQQAGTTGSPWVPDDAYWDMGGGIA
jgi:hypothetical protein